MLLKILKLFGLDVPAKIAAARTEFERRVEDAADYAKQATLTAALVAAFSAVAALLFIVAAGVGLFALYRVIAEYYGLYAGLGAVAALLIAAASVLLLAARTRAQSLSELRFVRQSSSPALPPAPEGGRPKLHPLAHRRRPKLFRQTNRRPIYSSLWRLCSRGTSNSPYSVIRFWINSSEA